MLTRNFLDTPAENAHVAEPFAEIEQLVQQINHMLDQWLISERRAGPDLTDFPLVNLSEDHDRYILKAMIPGVKTEDLDIRAAAKSVSISGEPHIPEEREGVRYRQRERQNKQFSRIVSLSREIDPDQVDAQIEKGVLTLRLPKTKEFRTKQIPIK